jgi:hypothetical protein
MRSTSSASMFKDERNHGNSRFDDLEGSRSEVKSGRACGLVIKTCDLKVEPRYIDNPNPRRNNI